ncbi:PREDICTED: transforming growth factor-beta receptor-associated protein 1 [Nanorana parkeri]|uniref:transforming growth factor-beta receptor-associated protein 1 n=1 Tax=Nanorana parkeri TaxID=125878 RepID=UPI000854DACA|nr:PREDICTED: transforming growth factor-beta receptor-associated protein 1 [Nanorana parkeri]
MSVQAFRLVCASGKEHLPAGIQIECLECSGHDLYIGTSDGCLHHLLLVEESGTESAGIPLGQQSDYSNTNFTTTRQNQRQLGVKKPICELRAASALGRLLVLCDNTISLLCSDSLEPVPGTKIRGVLSFTLNENPVSGDPFSVEVCLISSKRRTVQIFSVGQERVQIVREVATPEQPCCLAADGYYLCLALSSRYVILNYNTGHCQDLFPYPSEQKRPIIKRISRQEFLLAGPGGLGMFATVAGISQRAPVRWSENVIGAAVSFPYVLALDEEFITVHSMLDQQQKQSLPFKEGVILQDFEGRVIVATPNGVYVLIPLPLEKQIQDLLSNQRVEEALVLAKGARRNIPKEKFQVMYRRILQQAGFIQFAKLQFLEAKELFRTSHLDIRELISLYPLLMPSSSGFIRAHPPLHEYADLNQLTRGDQEKVSKCKRFLMSYLSEIRSTEVANGYQQDVDTALLKLYAEADHESLLDLLVSDNACEVGDSAAWLEKHKKYFALGLLYHYNEQDAAALQVWVRIVNGDLEDNTRPDLFEYVVDFLTFSKDQQLVWQYVDWVLQKSEQIGVQIFTKRSLDEQLQNGFCPDTIVSHLCKYRQALLLYLEHLVMDKMIQKEKYHTHLAVLYLEEILRLKSRDSLGHIELEELHRRFQNLLRQSDLYRVLFLIDKIKGTDLHMERAILHGKLEEHDQALDILVHQLKDFAAAESYCVWNSEGRDAPYRKRLFQLLLSSYLRPSTPDNTLTVAAVDLLNNHPTEFDAASVLHLLPEEWSVQLLSPFLAGAMRGHVHALRMSQVAVGLARTENIIYKKEKLNLKEKPIILSEKKFCHVCRKPFQEPVFARQPNGHIVHTHCATNQHVNSSIDHVPSQSKRT